LNDAESKAQQIYAAAEKAEREAAERAQTTIREANDEAYKILQGAEDMQATTERQMTDLRAQTQQEVDELKKQAQHEAERIIAAAELIRQQARQDAADITSNGQREADRLIAEAEGQAQDILQGVRSEAGRWHAIINDLQAQKQRVEQEWFALTNNFLARLQQEQQNLRMERRGEARCSLRVNVRISSENVKDVIARSEDLSAHGMRLVTDQNLPVGTSISLEMELPDGGEPVQCNGIVRWASALDGNGRNSFRLGISLSATHNEDAERLSKFLNTVAQPVN
jgi:cell division septum initiation protein DivIVA